MRIVPYTLLVSALLSLSACVVVVPIALMKSTSGSADDKAVGDRGVPVGSTSVQFAKGLKPRGAYAYSETRGLFLVPYNAQRRGTEPIAAEVFGLGFRVLALDGKEIESSFKLNPSHWTLTLADGQRVQAIGHRLEIDDANACRPGHVPASARTFNNPLVDAALRMKGWHSNCVEVFFPVAPPSPKTRFNLTIDGITESGASSGPLTIEFESHYGL
jgi:hypothetical protein